ncbi:MAG TPA: sulfotransferase, partial [Phototrophicaceae bacterium]|nr:sulfotransferase [Phototrophicaceae bacterium]
MPVENVGPIFVLASGQRCGSTLLQRFLSTHQDILIWGEHDGVLNKIFAGFERLYEWHDLFGHHYDKYLETGVARNFIANMNPPADVITDTQIQLVTNYWQEPAAALGKHIWGFKEVLYDAHMAMHLQRLFPTARIVFLTRHPFK